MNIPTAPKYVKDGIYFKTCDPNGKVFRFWEHKQEGTWKYCVDRQSPWYVFTAPSKEKVLKIISSK